MSSKAESAERSPATKMEEVGATPSLLLVDDEPAALRVLSKLLERHGYQCRLAGSVEEARSVLADAEFELVLSDVNMPGGTGIELLEHVMNAHPHTAIVMVTGADDPDLAEKALLMGAYGYVIKPFRPNEILINVTNALRRRSLEIENQAHRDHLAQMVQERTQHLWEAIRNLEVAHDDLRSSNEETIEKLSIAAEYRDNETAQHIHRMSSYCELLARKLGFDTARCERLRMASVMHDVGKIGVPDSILLKPGKLTPEEYEIMKQHAEMGYRVLESDKSDLLDLAAKIARTHHEWWDGTGYPRGLKGEEIPIEGRIAAIADVFDALTSNRVYRKAFHLGQAVDMMTQERGTHFDPDLLDLFLDSLDSIIVIREKAPAE